MFKRRRNLGLGQKQAKKSFLSIRNFLPPIVIYLILILLLFLLYLYLERPYLISPIPVPINFKEAAESYVKSSENSSKIEELLKKANILYVSIKPGDNQSFLVKLKTEEEVIFSSKKDINSQISSLQLILSRFTIEGKRINRLDFRFEKPVIVFR